MNYLLFVFGAVLFQSVYYLLLKNALSSIPSETALIIVNTVASLIAAGYVMLSESQEFGFPTTTNELAAIVIAGVALSGGLLLFYRSLELGPVSIVQPIFGMTTVLVAISGAIIFSEPLTTRKMAGIALAGVAIWLVSG